MKQHTFHKETATITGIARSASFYGLADRAQPAVQIDHDPQARQAEHQQPGRYDREQHG